MRFTCQNLFLWIWCKSFQNLVSLFCFILIRHMLWDLLQLFYSKFKFYALIFLSQYFNISFNIPFYLLLYFVWVPEKRSCVTIPLWWGWHTFWCTRQRDRHGSIIIIIILIIVITINIIINIRLTSYHVTHFVERDRKTDAEAFSSTSSSPSFWSSS